MEQSNDELLALIAGGDADAWGVLVDRYAQSVWIVTGNYGLDETVRQDVLQTVWLRLFDKADTIREPGRLVGWLCRVARNECINVVRRRSRVYSLRESYERSDDEAPPVEARLEVEDDRAVVARAYETLDERCRELLALCIQDPPIKYDEIADQLKMSRGSVGPTRQRCLEKLRRVPAVMRLMQAAKLGEAT